MKWGRETPENVQQDNAMKNPLVHRVRCRRQGAK